ncbi:MAG: hypothetical protein ACI87O_002582 [Planctomycetota bacterium]|jgi:hypothetical protein
MGPPSHQSDLDHVRHGAIHPLAAEARGCGTAVGHSFEDRTMNFDARRGRLPISHSIDPAQRNIEGSDQ